VAMSSWRNKHLWLIVALGLAIRVALAFAFHGTNHVLIEEFAGSEARSWDWHGVYESGLASWSYPPLFLGWLAGASWLSDASGLSFHGLAKLGPTLADVGLALAVYVYLGWRRAGERIRLAGAALVMLGPVFVATSGYHGQIDSVAILPAVLALMVWERRPEATRGVETGLLVGLGGAVKTVPLLMVLPLLMSARSWQEGAKLVAAAILIPALVLLPLWASGIDLHRVTGYSGVPGWGGMSLALDPVLGWRDITSAPVHGSSNELTQGLHDASRWITAATLIGYTVFIFRYRPAVIDAVVLLWLAIFAFSPNFFLTYIVWGLPFFIMAGYLRESAILQAVLLVPTIAYYLSLWPTRGTVIGIAYVPMMIGLWVFWVFAVIAVGRRIVQGRETRSDRGLQRPLVKVAAGSSG
jgi:hypothetical protein